MKSTLIELFSQYKELFSGSLGEVPGVKVKLNVKDNVIPFHSRPYSIPKDFEALAKRKFKTLLTLVFQSKIQIAYTSPSFFRRKKDGRIRFISDLRKLNASLQRKPSPLPVPDDVIWKM